MIIVDRALAEIVERCLAADPKQRYPNAQAVLAALDARDANRARLPMMLLGWVGPALVLLVVSLFAWSGFSRMLERAGEELTRSALKSNEFAAKFVARTAGNELERRFEAVEQVAFSEELREALRAFHEPGQGDSPEALLDELSDPEPLRDKARELQVLEPKRERFRSLEARKKLQAEFEKQAPLLSEQAKRERSEALQRKVRDVRRIAEDANRDFDKRVREAEMDITREIFGIVQEYGKDQGFSVIQERSTLVYTAPAVDITAEVVKRYDAKQK